MPSTITWKGSAAAVAGVKIWTFTTAGTIGDIITVTIGAKTVTYATTSATVSIFLPLLQVFLAALDSDVYPEFAEVAWTNTASTLVATDNTPGKPSIITVSTNSAGTTINTGAITGATNATPIVITSAAHGLATGTTVTITGITVNTAANGTFFITVLSSSTFSLNGSVGNGTYGTGGVWTAANGNLTTVSSGPFSLSTAANYSGGVLPATGDTLYVDLEGAQILYDLDTQSAVVLAVRRITAQDVTIGLPTINVDGAPYTEYRQTYWLGTATSDYLDTASGRIKLDALTGQTTYQQQNSGSGIDANTPAVLLRGSNSSNVYNVFGGEVGFAFLTAEACHLHTLNQAAGTTIVCGLGCTIDTVNNYGGTLTVNSAIGTALNHPAAGDGTTNVEGAGAVAQITLQSGTVNYNSIGTLGGNTVLANGASLSFDADHRAKAITNPISIYSASVSFSDANGVITGGYTLKYVDCVGVPTLKPNSQVVVTSL